MLGGCVLVGIAGAFCYIYKVKRKWNLEQNPNFYLDMDLNDLETAMNGHLKGAHGQKLRLIVNSDAENNPQVVQVVSLDQEKEQEVKRPSNSFKNTFFTNPGYNNANLKWLTEEDTNPANDNTCLIPDSTPSSSKKAKSLNQILSGKGRRSSFSLSQKKMDRNDDFSFSSLPPPPKTPPPPPPR